MITPSFALTATERVLPRLALDFTTAVLDPRVTVTRASNTATVTNANGSISAVGANLPRFDYANGICKGLLIEEARTNLLINSIWDGAVTGAPGTPPTSWINTQTTGSISTIAPSTYAAGNALTFTCTAQRRVIYQRPSVVANTSYTASFDVVTTTAGVQIYNVVDFRSMPAGAAITTFTLNGATATGATAMPIGTHKVTITASIAATAGTLDVFVGLGIQGNITSAVTISNIQFEAGAFATSYIPTVASQVTRNADVATMTGTNFTDWFNASQGTLYAEGNTFNAGPRAAGSNPICLAGIYDGTASNRLLLTLINNTATQIAGRFVAGGTSLIAGLGASFALGSVVKEAGSYISGNSAIYGNSVVAGTSAGAFTFTPNQLIFGAAPNGTAEYLCGWVRKVNFYNIALTQAQLAAITK